MEESYAEGLASHGDPESCAGARESAGEALTGAHAGRVSSREINKSRSADDVVLSGRQHAHVRKGECMGDPARSKTSCMHGKLHAREPGDPVSGQRRWQVRKRKGPDTPWPRVPRDEKSGEGVPRN